MQGVLSDFPVVALRPYRPSWRLAPSLVVALGVHAALLTALALMAVRVVEPAPPIRVSILDLAPPPPAPPPGPGTDAHAAAVPSPPQQQPVVHTERAPRQPARSPKKAERRVQPAVPIEAEPAPPPVVEAGGADGPVGGRADGVQGGAVGGVVGGQIGGTVGGSGPRIFRSDEVAELPSLLSGPKPQYPPMARARGIEGLVVVEAVIGRDGDVEPEGARVIESVASLDDAALAAVRRWRFRPGRDATGAAVRVAMRVPIRFQLR